LLKPKKTGVMNERFHDLANCLCMVVRFNLLLQPK
jgi:hypothetical protein